VCVLNPAFWGRIIRSINQLAKRELVLIHSNQNRLFVDLLVSEFFSSSFETPYIAKYHLLVSIFGL